METNQKNFRVLSSIDWETYKMLEYSLMSYTEWNRSYYLISQEKDPRKQNELYRDFYYNKLGYFVRIFIRLKLMNKKNKLYSEYLHFRDSQKDWENYANSLLYQFIRRKLDINQYKENQPQSIQEIGKF